MTPTPRRSATSTPEHLDARARENWSELWDDLEPLLRGVRETGETFSANDRPFYIERSGFDESVYFDISYSAVPASASQIDADKLRQILNATWGIPKK